MTINIFNLISSYFNVKLANTNAKCLYRGKRPHKIHSIFIFRSFSELQIDYIFIILFYYLKILDRSNHESSMIIHTISFKYWIPFWLLIYKNPHSFHLTIIKSSPYFIFILFRLPNDLLFEYIWYDYYHFLMQWYNITFILYDSMFFPRFFHLLAPFRILPVVV